MSLKLNWNDIRLLWYGDFWDGPMNGLCIYNDRKCWFEMIEESPDSPVDAPRRFIVVNLSAQELADEEHWHDLFRSQVGTHMDVGEPCPEVKPKALHREFYEVYSQRRKPDYLDRPALGWFVIG